MVSRHQPFTEHQMSYGEVNENRNGHEKMTYAQYNPTYALFILKFWSGSLDFEPQLSHSTQQPPKKKIKMVFDSTQDLDVTIH